MLRQKTETFRSSSRALLEPDAETLQKTEAQADGADTSMENLAWKLFEILKDVSEETWDWPTGHATEQAQSSSQASGHATEPAQPQEDQFLEDECDEAIYKKILQWFLAHKESVYYNEPALKLNKKMWDIISRDKEGVSKERNFKKWCRRVAEHAEATSTATRLAEHAEAAGTATEHDTNCYKSLAFDLLSNDLIPKQRRQAK